MCLRLDTEDCKNKGNGMMINI